MEEKHEDPNPETTIGYTLGMSKALKSASIHKQMPVADILALCPESQGTLAEYGLHCVGCAGSAYETLEEGCLGHGFEQDEIDELVDDLNTMIDELPIRPEMLVVTLPAAQAIKNVMKEEKRVNEGLAVIVDGHGGFCMEFRPEPERDEKVFSHTAESSVRVFASTLTLKRIGGSTIDFRDGRFKLDLAGDVKMGGCGCASGSGSCDCA